MPTPSTTALEQTLRARLLAFAPKDGGPSLGAALAGQQIYIDEPPETAPFPYGVLSTSLPPGELDAPVLLRGDFVLLLYDRPQAKRAALKRLGDVAVQALAGWQETAANGWLKVPAAQSRAVPTFGDVTGGVPGVSRDLVIVRVTGSLLTIPQFLTQYGTP